MRSQRPSNDFVTEALEATLQTGSSRFEFGGHRLHPLGKRWHEGGIGIGLLADGYVEYEQHRAGIFRRMVPAPRSRQRLPAPLTVRHWGNSWTITPKGDVTSDRPERIGRVIEWPHPLWALGAAGCLSGSARHVGDDLVRGIQCRRVDYLIDLSAPGDPRLPIVFPDRMVVGTASDGCAWVDEQGRIRRVSASLATESRSATPVLWYTTELWDFGVEVDPRMPSSHPTPDAGPASAGASPPAPPPNPTAGSV